MQDNAQPLIEGIVMLFIFHLIAEYFIYIIVTRRVNGFLIKQIVT